MPELQAPVSFGNMCYRHRTPFGVYKIIKVGGGVVPEVGQTDHSTVVTDHAHVGNPKPCHLKGSRTDSL